jgi:hypothetical protein
MRRTTLLTIVLVVASAGAIPVVGMAATGDDVSPQTNSTTERTATAPGERLSGVVGVQGAELEGEIDSRAFGLQVARAATNDSKADVVAETVGDLETRLADLEQRKEALDEARENGSMSEGEYRARVTELAAQTETVQRLADQTNETASGLPADLLESNGIDATAIQTLKDDAKNLSGPEVAEIARSIAGEGVGKTPGKVPGDVPGEQPDDAGPPEDTGPDRPGDDDATETDTPTGTEESGDGSSDRGNGGQAGQSGSGNGGR